MSDSLVHVSAEAVLLAHDVQNIDVEYGAYGIRLPADDGHVVLAFVARVPGDGDESVRLRGLHDVVVIQDAAVTPAGSRRHPPRLRPTGRHPRGVKKLSADDAD